MKFQTKVARTILGFVGALAISTTLVMPAVAADSVTQVITGGGSLSASIADASMGAVTYSHSVGGTTGTLVLSVNDPRGTSAGWNVTVASTAFVRTGALLTNSNAYDIPAAGFLITAAGTPSMTAGQAVDPTDGPYAGSVSGLSLAAARKTIAANVGFGSGSYTQTLGVSLVIPATSQTGTYVATLSVLVSSAP